MRAPSEQAGTALPASAPAVEPSSWRPLDHLTDVTVPLETDARCADVGLDPPDFDEPAELDTTLTTSMLVGWKVPLSTAPSEHRGLGLHEGARLVARTEDLARCATSEE